MISELCGADGGLCSARSVLPSSHCVRPPGPGISEEMGAARVQRAHGERSSPRSAQRLETGAGGGVSEVGGLRGPRFIFRFCFHFFCVNIMAKEGFLSSGSVLFTE